jgi:hypothetical protein
MSELQHIRMLSRYAAWANDRLYEALAELPVQELTKPRSIVFGSILRTLNHVYAIDLVWRAHLLGMPQVSLPETQKSPRRSPIFAPRKAGSISGISSMRTTCRTVAAARSSGAPLPNGSVFWRCMVVIRWSVEMDTVA